VTSGAFWRIFPTAVGLPDQPDKGMEQECQVSKGSQKSKRSFHAVDTGLAFKGQVCVHVVSMHIYPHVESVLGTNSLGTMASLDTQNKIYEQLCTELCNSGMRS